MHRRAKNSIFAGRAKLSLLKVLGFLKTIIYHNSYPNNLILLNATFILRPPFLSLSSFVTLSSYHIHHRIFRGNFFPSRAVRVRRAYMPIHA